MSAGDQYPRGLKDQPSEVVQRFSDILKLAASLTTAMEVSPNPFPIPCDELEDSVVADTARHAHQRGMVGQKAVLAQLDICGNDVDRRVDTFLQQAFTNTMQLAEDGWVSSAEGADGSKTHHYQMVDNNHSVLDIARERARQRGDVTYTLAYNPSPLFQ